LLSLTEAECSLYVSYTFMLTVMKIVMVFVSYERTATDYLRFVVLTAVTVKNAVFWDIKNPVRISQETHYVSDTNPSRLLLCKI
jgi:archaellum biogenesis protein FlaJ (TadC family)